MPDSVPKVQNRSADEILSKAYDEARTLFSTELTQDECKRIWVQEKSSMSDVVEALAQSKLKYDNKPASKARKWLAVLSGRVVYYNTVLDVLVQPYPEYVSLAWGAMKFLFTVSPVYFISVNVAKFFRSLIITKRRQPNLRKPSLE